MHRPTTILKLKLTLKSDWPTTIYRITLELWNARAWRYRLQVQVSWQTGDLPGNQFSVPSCPEELGCRVLSSRQCRYVSRGLHHDHILTQLQTLCRAVNRKWRSFQNNANTKQGVWVLGLWWSESWILCQGYQPKITTQPRATGSLRHFK